jgi:dienelactone hydrolase
MMHLARLTIMILCTAMQPAAADDFYREELRIPMAEAGPRGLEALLIRPSGSGRYPLALISHGTPHQADDRSGYSPYVLEPHAIEFARRGFAALVVLRRGYGGSDGGYAEDFSSHLASARVAANDLRAAVAAMDSRSDVTTQGMIAVGVSTGGLASIALSENPPPGLAAVINFAGGRRSSDPAKSGTGDLKDEDALVGAFATIGLTSRTPMLWVYAANDPYYGPELLRRLLAVFTAGGGRAQLIDAPAFRNDGHKLFSGAGIPIWIPLVDVFLREQHLGTIDLLAVPLAPNLPFPPQVNDMGRAGFADYLAEGRHKAFAASPKGAFGYSFGWRTVAEAQRRALAFCKRDPDCVPYAIDDELVSKDSAEAP